MKDSFSGRKKAIIWDWNGTLLDDISICIESMNILLEERGLPMLNRPTYREIFSFPVRSYYEKAGFDFRREDFEIPALEFIKLYAERLPGADLFPETFQVLEHLAARGYYQTVLSAMEHESLVRSLKDKGVFTYFNLVNGISDHFAHSKLEVGAALISGLEFARSEILLIGDSLHDLEVAEALDVDCLLVSNGHQSARRLLEKTPAVTGRLSDIIQLFD